MVLRTLVGFVRNWKREKRLATLLLGQHAGQDGDNEGDMLVVRTETMSEQKKVDGEVQEAINEAENDAFALIISAPASTTQLSVCISNSISISLQAAASAAEL